jgi:hypothetical protein
MNIFYRFFVSLGMSQNPCLAVKMAAENFGLVPALPDFIKSRTRMAQVRIRSIIERSEYGMKRALEAAV